MAVSIADYAKARGAGSAWSARKRDASNRGQNAQKYNVIRNVGGILGADYSNSGSTGSSTPTNNVTLGTNIEGQGVNASVAGTGSQAGPGVTSGSSSSTSTSVTRGYKPTDQVNNSYNAMKAWERNMPSDYEESEYVERYRDRLGDVEAARPDDFKSKYTSQIDSILDNIYNDNGFSYTANDLQNDDLYKMYSQQYQQSAERAMRDTMGNASALTGGYGSTAAQVAGQQTYDQTMAGLNDKVMDFYDRAYQRYSDDRANRYNQLGAFQSQDNIDYSRYRDTVSDWQNDRDYYAGRLDNERNYDLNVYQTNSNNYWTGANYLSGRYDADRDADFAQYQQDVNDQQWREEFDTQNDQWQKNFDTQNEQWLKNYELQKEAQDLDNEYKRLQMEQIRQNMALKAAGGSSGGSGGRRSGGSSRRSSGSGSTSTKSAGDLVAGVGNLVGNAIANSSSAKNKTLNYSDYYADMAEVAATEGSDAAADYREYVKDNYNISYIPTSLTALSNNQRRAGEAAQQWMEKNKKK